MVYEHDAKHKDRRRTGTGMVRGVARKRTADNRSNAPRTEHHLGRHTKDDTPTMTRVLSLPCILNFFL